MKRLLALVTVTVLILHGGGTFVVPAYAQGPECETCSSAPKDLELYIETMKKLINVIPVSPKPNAEGSEGSAGAQAASSEAQADAIYREVLYSDVGDGYLFDEIDMLLEGSVMTRDGLALQQLDSLLASRVEKSLAAGRITDFLSDADYAQIDGYLAELEYMSLAKNGSGQYVMKGVSAQYKELAAMLWSFNKIMKTLHSEQWMSDYLGEINSGYDTIYTQDPDEAVEAVQLEQLSLASKYLKVLTNTYMQNLTSGRTGQSTDRLEFSNDQMEFFLALWSIHDDYVCATGIVSSCEESWGSWKETAKNSRGYVKDTRQGRSKSAINTFKRSRSDLKDAFDSGSQRDKQGWTQRENMLLHSIYGQDIPSKQKWWNNPGGPSSPFAIDAHVDPMPVGIQATKQMILNSYKYAAQSMGKKDTTKDAVKSSQEGDKAKQVGGEDNPNYADTDEKRKSMLEKWKDEIDEAKDNAWLSETAGSGLLTNQFTRLQKIASFQATYLSVIAMQYEFENQALLIDTNVVTKRMPMLSAAVHKNMSDIGEKGNRGGIYNSMGQVCEIQCANIDSKCWFEGK